MSEQGWGREEGFRRDDESLPKREELLRSEHTEDDSVALVLVVLSIFLRVDAD